jgi:hypothetical protein
MTERLEPPYTEHDELLELRQQLGELKLLSRHSLVSLETGSLNMNQKKLWKWLKEHPEMGI